MQYRQGDLLFEKIDEIPTETKSETNILARGEVSGHAHFATGEVDVYKQEEKGDFYLDVQGDASIEHLLEESLEWTGDHNEIKLPEGKYRVILQKEYDPYEQEARRVMD